MRAQPKYFAKVAGCIADCPVCDSLAIPKVKQTRQAALQRALDE